MSVNIYKKFELHLKNHPEITLNENERIVNGVCNLLEINCERYGEYYCPCRLERTHENICPCIHHLMEIDEKGHCCCNLFVKKEK